MTIKCYEIKNNPSEICGEESQVAMNNKENQSTLCLSSSCNGPLQQNK
jgi:hypothetical protein